MPTLRMSRRSWLAATLTLASTLTSACGQEAAPPPEQTSPPALVGQRAALSELITNGTFDSSTAPWWTSANTQSRVENSQWRLDVTASTTNVYDAIAGESGISLTSGQGYTLAFTTSASASGTLTVTVQLDASPYTAVLTQKVAVDGTQRRYSFPFTSSLTNAGHVQVTFQIGGGASRTVWLDNVSLTTGSSPVAMTSGFYVDPNSAPAVWAKANPGDGRAASIQSSIASKPIANWFGNWSGDIASSVSSYVGAAAAANKLPVLVAYNIPGRDCGSYSSGGAGSPDAYRTWISGFASGIGNRPAIVLIEPDSVAQLDCLPDDANRQTRLDLLNYATQQLRDKAPNTWAYLDAGNAGWIAADTMAQRLNSAGVGNIRGFVVNISNFFTNADSISYGNAVGSALTSHYGYTRPFAVDTSRNGNGSNGQWCNPAGRKLGTVSQAGGGADLLLWVKVPGGSDGTCGAAPSTPAGTFSPALAYNLIYGY